MKKLRIPARGRLRLARETLRQLSHLELTEVRGGSDANLVAELMDRSDAICPAPAAPLRDFEPAC